MPRSFFYSFLLLTPSPHRPPSTCVFKEVQKMTKTFAGKSKCYKLREVKSIMSEMNFILQ